MGRTISVPVLLLAAALPLALAGCGPKAPDQSAAPTVEGTSAAEL